MVKATVKINKANNQKTLLLGKDTPFSDGEIVEVSKIKKATQKNLEDFYNENKEDFKTIIEELKENLDCLCCSPEQQLLDWYEKEFNIKIEYTGDLSDGYDIKCGDTWISCSGDFKIYNIEDSENYINFTEEDLENINSNLCKYESFNNNEENLEGFSLNKDKLNKEHFNNSLRIVGYILLKSKIQEELQNIYKEFIGNMDFSFYSWGGNFKSEKREFSYNDYNDIYKHNHSDLYLSVYRTDESKHLEIKLFLDDKKCNSITL